MRKNQINVHNHFEKIEYPSKMSEFIKSAMENDEDEGGAGSDTPAADADDSEEDDEDAVSPDVDSPNMRQREYVFILR